MIGRRDLTDAEKAQFAQSEDKDFLEIWDACKAYTMTSFERGLALFRSIRYVCRRPVPGNFVECGVWRGGSAMIAAKTLLLYGGGDRKIFLFDTFDGMTEPGPEDKDWRGNDAARLMDEDRGNREDSLMWAVASLEDVTRNMEKTGYDPALIHYIKGDVAKTLQRTRTGNIAVLRLDTDFYDSTLVELRELYPRLIQHGVLIIDDYGHWQGARAAVDEFFSVPRGAAGNGGRLPDFHWVDYTGRVAVRSELSPRRKRELYDYYPPGLEKIDLQPLFPSVTPTSTEDVKWKYLRKDVPHIWRTDMRSSVPLIGCLSVEEAQILYNNALQFAGKRGLEIGCHMGWSTAHILSAGIHLDVIDPRLTEDAHGPDVNASLSRVPTTGSFRLWAGFSPSIVEPVAALSDEPFSFAFIDGNHDGEGPRLDAEAVAPHCAETALIMLHDLVAPAVSSGLHWLGDNGWNVRVYNTMQVMGVAWRGDCQPVDHIADERVPVPDIPGLI